MKTEEMNQVDTSVYQDLEEIVISMKSSRVSYTAEEIAGSYALDACDEYKEDENLEYNLNVLVEAGASFNFADAFNFAKYLRTN